MAETQTGGMILAQFLRWLMEHHASAAASQSDIARKTRISQSLVYKLLAGVHHEPALDTYQKLTGSFWVEWREFLERNPRVREQLTASYRWALGERPAPTGPTDPRAQVAQGYVSKIFASENEALKAMVLQVLQTHTDFERAARTPKARRANGSRPRRLKATARSGNGRRRAS